MPKPNNIPTRAVAKAKRREEAAERQAKYDALSDAEKARRNPAKFKEN